MSVALAYAKNQETVEQEAKELVWQIMQTREIVKANEPALRA
jgi:hypothetical protein